MTPDPRPPRQEEPRRRRLLRRLGLGVAAILALAALLWLAIQLALDSPLLARVVNRRPQRLLVQWSSASMPIPGHVTLQGVRLRGRNRRLDWYVELDRVALRVDLRSLFDRTFSASEVRGRGVRFYLRRHIADAADEELVPFMPPIPGLDPEPVEPRPPGKRPPGWKIDLRDLDLADFAEIWIDELRLSGAGSVAGDVSVQVRGPLAVPHVRLAWKEGELSIRGQPIGHRLDLDLDLELAPVPTRGLQLEELFRSLDTEMELTGEVSRLTFLDAYLRNAGGLRLEGNGRVQVTGGMSAGVLTPESRLTVEADSLTAELPSFSITGSGGLSLAATPPTGDATGPGTELSAELRDVQFKGPSLPRAVSRTISLTVSTEGADLLAGFPDPAVFLDMPAVELTDLGAFAPLLPAGVPIRLLGGTAVVSTRLDLTRSEGDAHLAVVSHDLDLQLGKKPLRSELELYVDYRGGMIPSSFDVSGSRLRLQGDTTPPLGVELEIHEATVELGEIDGLEAGGKPPPAMAALRLADGDVHAEGRISDLAALNDSFSYGRWLQLEGPVTLDARLAASEGQLEPGSRVDMGAERLVAHLADWSFAGRAQVTTRVLADGGTELGLDFGEVELARHGRSHIRAPDLRLRAAAPPPGNGTVLGGSSVHLEISSAQIFDVTPLNDYLPSSDLVRLLDGSARLDASADLSMARGKADLVLDGRALTLELLGEHLRTNLRLETHMSSDDPESLRFTVADSSLRFDETRWLQTSAEGEREEEGEGEEPPWHGQVDLVHGSLVVEQPLAVAADVRLHLQDTRPLFYIVTRQLPTIQWFERWLVFEGVDGAGRIELEPDRIRLSGLDVHGGGGHLSGQLSLAATSAGSGVFDRLEDLALDGELEQTRPLEFASLNRLLPHNGAIRFGAGEGRLSGNVHLEETSGTGSVRLVGSGLEAALLDQTLKTDLRFGFELSSDDLLSRRFMLHGSRLRLDRTRWLADRRADKRADWWGELEILSGEVELGEALAGDGSVRLKLRDNWPLLYLLAERNRVVRWFDKLLEIEDIEGTAHVRVDQDALRVDDLHITGQRLLVEGLLDFGEDTEYGLFYVRFRGLAAAVELVNDKRSFKIIAPRAWYEKRLAEMQSSP